MNDKTGSNTMWGGRFAAGPDAVMEAINASIDVDRRLAAQDIEASRAHAAMLAATGIISDSDAAAIREGLLTVLSEIEAGDVSVLARARGHPHERGEPAHGADRRRRRGGCTPPARATTRWRPTSGCGCAGQCDAAAEALTALMRALVAQAEAGAALVMPGFTHLQVAQPVTWGHHMLAYVEMLDRDRGRFRDARARMNESPLGAAALAGTSFPIDREMTAAALGFERPMANSLDAVSDRDFALEFLAAAAICATHLSRLAEELVLWSSAQFRFVRLSDRFATGSSIMPQKRNPDAAELVRAKVGRVAGALVALLTVMKGLPLAYSKDMQEDKEAVFDAADALMLALAAMAGMVGRPARRTPSGCARRRGRASPPPPTSPTGWCAGSGLPFREAHHVTGALVRARRGAGRGPGRPAAGRDAGGASGDQPRRSTRCLGVDNSVASRASYGGTAPVQVRAQVAPLAGGARVSARPLARIGLGLALLALADCGIKGDPVPPTPEDRSASRSRSAALAPATVRRMTVPCATPPSPSPPRSCSSPGRCGRGRRAGAPDRHRRDRQAEPGRGRSGLRQALRLPRRPLRQGDGVRPRRAGRIAAGDGAHRLPDGRPTVAFPGPLAPRRAGGRRRRGRHARRAGDGRLRGGGAGRGDARQRRGGGADANGKPLGIGNLGPPRSSSSRAPIGRSSRE